MDRCSRVGSEKFGLQFNEFLDAIRTEQERMMCWQDFMSFTELQWKTWWFEPFSQLLRAIEWYTRTNWISRSWQSGYAYVKLSEAKRNKSPYSSWWQDFLIGKHHMVIIDCSRLSDSIFLCEIPMLLDSYPILWTDTERNKTTRSIFSMVYFPWTPPSKPILFP